MARPTKLTPELQKKICDAVARGASQEAAAALAGISERALYHWVKQGQQGKEPYAGFFRDLTCARAEDECELVKVVRRHTITDWRAAQWLLAVKWPDRYGDVVKHEVRLTRMTDAELDAYIAEGKRTLAEVSGSGGPAAGAPAAADGATD